MYILYRNTCTTNNDTRYENVELVWQKKYYTPVLLSLRTRKVVYCRHYKFVVARTYFRNALKERTSKTSSFSGPLKRQSRGKKVHFLKMSKVIVPQWTVPKYNLILQRPLRQDSPRWQPICTQYILSFLSLCLKERPK